MKKKYKKPIRVSIRTESEAIEHLLTEALAYAKDIEIHAERVEKPGAFQIPSDADILIICDQIMTKNEKALNRLSRQQGSSVPIYVATYRTRLADFSGILSLMNGCILLDGDMTLLPDIVRMARDGYVVMPDAMPGTFINIGQEQDLVRALSLYECALLHELGFGRNERVIARRLGTTSGTIGRRLRALYKKLHVSLSADAASFAKRHKEDLHKRRRDLIRKEGATVDHR